MRNFAFRLRLERETRLIAFSGELVDEGNQEAKDMERMEKPEEPEETNRAEENVEDKEVSKEEIDQLVEQETSKREEKAEQETSALKKEVEDADVRAKEMEAEAAKTKTEPLSMAQMPGYKMNVADPEAAQKEKTTDEIVGVARTAMTADLTPDHDKVEGQPTKEVEVGGGAVQMAQVEAPSGDTEPKAAASRTNAEQAESQTLAADTSAAQQAENQQRGPEEPTPEKQQVA